MKKWLLALLIVVLIILNIHVINEEYTTTLNMDNASLHVKAALSTTENNNITDYTTSFTLDGPSELLLSDIDTYIKKSNDTYQLSYRGLLKGYQNKRKIKGFRVLGFSFTEETSEKTTISKYFSDSIHFVQSSNTSTDHTIKQLWHIDRTVPINLSK